MPARYIQAAGILGAKWGIKITLISGLTLQLFSYGLLFGWQDDWSKTEAIIYVTFAQMFAGVAKDLTKLGGKTVTKLVRIDLVIVATSFNVKIRLSISFIHIRTFLISYLTTGDSRRTRNKTIQISIADNWMEKFSQGSRLLLR